MLTKEEQNYLATIPDEGTVTIKPYSKQLKNIADALIDKIKDTNPDLEIKFLGASALKISGRGDIDIYVIAGKNKHKNITSQLQKIFGRPKEGSVIEWNFIIEGSEVSIYIDYPQNLQLQRQIKVFNILKDSPALLKQYESIKTEAAKHSLREYQRQKYIFYNKILKYNKPYTP